VTCVPVPVKPGWCNRIRASLACVLLAQLSACGNPAADSWSGYVEGEYVYIAAPIGGALTTLSVQRGAEVKRGTLLFELDADAERAAREQAAAQAAAAGAQAQDLDTGKRALEIDVIRAQLTQAQALATQADSELARQQRLVSQGYVTASHLDEARAAAAAAAAHVRELTSSLKVSRLPARGQARAAATASTEAARFALEQARWRESQKTQSAPADARVADTFFRQGEWVNAGQPVVSLLPKGATKVRFFVPEAALATIQIGAIVSVRCDGCPAPITSRITFVSTQAEYTPPVIYSNSQRSRLVYLIEARPDAADDARLRPGQPVDVSPTARKL